MTTVPSSFLNVHCLQQCYWTIQPSQCHSLFFTHYWFLYLTSQPAIQNTKVQKQLMARIARQIRTAACEAKSICSLEFYENKRNIAESLSYWWSLVILIPPMRAGLYSLPHLKPQSWGLEKNISLESRFRESRLRDSKVELSKRMFGSFMNWRSRQGRTHTWEIASPDPWASAAHQEVISNLESFGWFEQYSMKLP